MRINTNIPALQSYNALQATNSQLAKSIQKLSTGLRINSAADDAAGLAISEKMRAQYRGLDVASSNAQDGISMIQTAEGALNETHSILQRMRELSVQAANDTLTQEDRSYIQLEVDQLKEEITRISNTTQFNKKQLLDGSAAAIWSSSDNSTKAIINGGLRSIDQFGQKNAVEGNYKITIKTDPGQGQVQKSDVFKIKHENVVMGVVKGGGINNVRVDNVPAGNYNVTTNAAAGAKAMTVEQIYLQKMNSAAVANGGMNVKYSAAAADKAAVLFAGLGTAANYATGQNQSVLMEVTEVGNSDKTAGQYVRMNIQVKQMGADGSTHSYSANDVVITTAGMTGSTDDFWAAAAKTNIKINLSAAKHLSVGDKMVMNYANGGGATITVSATVNQNWNESWAKQSSGGKITTAAAVMVRQFAVSAALKNTELRLETFYLNEVNGTSYESTVVLGLDDVNRTAADKVSFEAAYVGQVAKGDVKLRDLDKFWDANGKFMLEDPKTLTLTQGDGTSASITLYSTDTLEDARKKLNDAIAVGLGQGKYVTNNTNSFVSFVDEGTSTANTSESVAGTFVVRSIRPGAAGEINVAGDEDIIKAFGLNEIQSSKESRYEATITDAHSGNMIASGVKVTGNKLVGVLHENVDITFDPMANIEVKWNDKSKQFDVTRQANNYETILHLADNTTVFQIGANEGEDMGVNIGNMSAEALGVDKLVVTDRANAARSITAIDNAINKVSKQRAMLGAYQNRLEHTINNLTTSSTNLKSSESRIRDADMAKEMMNFTKLNILSNAGNSMLAQANNLPQSVLSLLR